MQISTLVCPSVARANNTISVEGRPIKKLWDQPIMTSTCALGTAEQGTTIFAGTIGEDGLVYGRAKNPTKAVSEERMASFEKVEAALALATGIPRR